MLPTAALPFACDWMVRETVPTIRAACAFVHSDECLQQLQQDEQLEKLSLPPTAQQPHDEKLVLSAQVVAWEVTKTARLQHRKGETTLVYHQDILVEKRSRAHSCEPREGLVVSLLDETNAWNDPLLREKRVLGV